MQNGKAAEIVLCSVFHGAAGSVFLNFHARDRKRFIARQQQKSQRPAAAAKIAYTRAVLYAGKIRQRHRICAERKLRGRNPHPVFPANQLLHPRLPKNVSSIIQCQAEKHNPKI